MTMSCKCSRPERNKTDADDENNWPFYGPATGCNDFGKIFQIKIKIIIFHIAAGDKERRLGFIRLNKENSMIFYFQLKYSYILQSDERIIMVIIEKATFSWIRTAFLLFTKNKRLSYTANSNMYYLRCFSLIFFILPSYITNTPLFLIFSQQLRFLFRPF